MPQVDVNLASESYSILIEPGLLRDLGGQVELVARHQSVLLAIDSNIASTHGRIAAESLRLRGFRVATHTLVAKETHKTLDAVHELYKAMLEARLERGSPVVALGGGIVGDIAGFAAATYLRGVPIVQVPTTLLAMVDASIGGKTGVNFPRADGQPVKNVIGAFWQPRAVVVDPETLETLPAREFRSGLAECVKHAMIADVDLLAFIADRAPAILNHDTGALTELIERCARIKASIVEDDEREIGRRALLNLGHTFAHAIEPIPELDLLHGEAVAIGLAAVLRCALRTKRINDEEERTIIDLLRVLKLPTRLSRPVESHRILEAMRYDKKTREGKMRLVVPIGLGRAEVIEDVPIDVVCDALEHIGAAPQHAGRTGRVEGPVG